MTGITYDKERVQLNLARLSKGSQRFEIVVDPDLAVEFKNGKQVDIKEVLKSEEIFSDAKKGMLASENIIQQVFNLTDPMQVAKKILEQGEVQITAEHREKLREEKRNRIIDIIHKNGVDPKTHLPHPASRLENAFKEANIRIDEYKTAEDQIQDILKELRAVLPIKFELKEVAVKIPPEYAAKSYSTVKMFGTMLREEWQTDGSWSVVIELPAGLETDFYDKINSLTHGNVETKVLNTK